MDNEISELQGFSKLPGDPDFKNDMEKYVKKEYKVTFIVLPVLYLVVFQIIKIVTGVFNNDVDYTRMLVPGLVLLGIFVIVWICFFIKCRLSIKKLKSGSIDGKILKPANEEKETKCLVVTETENGTKIKVKGKKAQAVYPYVSEGDKVRYHYGYPFPVELYDKSRGGVNICPFCGRENDLKAKRCSRCSNLLLR